jgi:hypothetical protein
VQLIAADGPGAGSESHDRCSGTQGAVYALLVGDGDEDGEVLRRVDAKVEDDEVGKIEGPCADAGCGRVSRVGQLVEGDCAVDAALVLAAARVAVDAADKLVDGAGSRHRVCLDVAPTQAVPGSLARSHERALGRGRQGRGRVRGHELVVGELEHELEAGVVLYDLAHGDARLDAR